MENPMPAKYDFTDGIRLTRSVVGGFLVWLQQNNYVIAKHDLNLNLQEKLERDEVIIKSFMESVEKAVLEMKEGEMNGQSQ